MVQARRNEQEREGLRPEFLDCDTCQLGEPERAEFACGWIAEEKRKPGLRPFPEATVCPGYTIRLPEVLEAARAYSWRNDGCLSSLWGSERLPRLAVDCVDILTSSIRNEEARQIREATRKDK